MNTLEPLIKSDWDHFFDIVHTEEDWITPLLNSIDGVSAREAFWRPGGSVASIADIVLHTNGWLESTLRAVLGMPEQDNEDWPDAPEATQANWTGLVDRLKLTVADLSRALHNLALEELYSPPKGRESRRSTMLTNILVHSAYHAGQVVKLRQAYAATEALALA
jgi:uncharacterized damage-inducible protein DinB